MTKFLRLNEVIDRTGLSRSSIYSFVQKNTFPKPIKLGIKASGWIESEVNEWMKERISRRGEL